MRSCTGTAAGASAPAASRWEPSNKYAAPAATRPVFSKSRRRMSHSVQARLLGRQRFDLDVLVPAVAAVVLQADVALAGMILVRDVELVGGAVGAFVLFGPLV